MGPAVGAKVEIKCGSKETDNDDNNDYLDRIISVGDVMVGQ